MKRTNIYLEDQQTDDLDELAAAEGVSRAELIRRMINQALNERSSSLEGDLVAIRDSFGVLSRTDVDLPSRDTDDRQLHLDSIWKQSG